MDTGDEIWPQVAKRSGRQPYVVRAATAADVSAIVALIQKEAARGNLLPRSRQNVEDTLPDWLVAARPASAPGAILGCVNLYPYRPGLVEVRSLAVDDNAQGEGVGTRLVQALVRRARQQGVRTLFALTRAVPFFERQGFRVTSRDRFPEKVWHACRQCPLIDNCDEIAVEMVIGEGGSGIGEK